MCVVALGGVPVGGFSIKKPGAVNKSRWMMRAIYTLKMYIFHKQFHTTPSEKKAIEDLCLFILSAYVRAWTLCQLPASAARNDLEFVKLLKSEVNRGPLWQAALSKMLSHLWYLSSSLVPLSLFNDDVSLDEKRKIVKAMQETEGIENPPKRALLPPTLINKDLNLDFFVDMNSKVFFRALKLSAEYQAHDPKTWCKNDDYLRYKAIIKSLRVVNDTAERGVKLITEFCNDLTRDEKQRQGMLIVIAEHRKNHPCK